MTKSQSNTVYIDFTALSDGSDLSEAIEAAYGVEGLGLVVIENVPNIASQRNLLLKQAFFLGQTDPEVLAKYEDPESHYSFGWSRGKEMLTKNVADFAKGSWYANALFNQCTANEKLISQFPSIYGNNIWPEEHPELAPLFLTMGRKIVSVGCKLAEHVDSFCSARFSNYPRNQLENICSLSAVPKARLLYYFPLESDEENAKDDSWCGWHNDHCALTCLLPGIFFDENGKPTAKPDGAGLKIKTRSGEIIHLSVRNPTNSLCFQIGETMQILSGGAVMATPHAVSGISDAGISRASFAVFMQPYHIYPMVMAPGSTVETTTFTAHLPENVPPLADRWNANDDIFGDFSKRTFEAYYELKKEDL